MWNNYHYDKIKIREICENIKDSILFNYNNSDDIYLFTGKAGSLLYLMNYQKYFYPGKDVSTFIQNELESIINFLEYNEVNCSLGYGFTGIGWLINYYINNHIENNLFEQEFLDNFDSYVLQGIKDYNFTKDYDIFTGYLGLGMYLLERFPKKNAVIGIKQIIELIQETTVLTEEYAYWIESKTNKINLGLAHGIPSIIIFLSKCYQFDIESIKCRFLIENGIRWMLKQTIESKPSNFSYVAGELRYTRVSWCYGDMCIAFMLILAGKRLNQNSWIQKGVELGLFSSKRRNFDDIHDACFCHGTTGNAHLFGRLYAYTKIEIFKESATFWLNETICKYTNNNLLGLETFWGMIDEYKLGFSLLEGLAGIGLCLLAATEMDEPRWDSIFLLS